MAADARPYKSKEQDGNGNEIILRDQQLVEQSSQTTMASTEYFEIVDVDGRMAKIPKDSMIGIVKNALGILLNGLADQTTVAKFLTLNGNTLGASAAATAASVLGALLKIRTGSFVSTSSMDLQARSGMLFVGNAQQTGFTGCFLLKRYGCETLYDGDGAFSCTYASEGHFTLSTSITGTFDVRWVLYGVAM